MLPPVELAGTIQVINTLDPTDITSSMRYFPRISPNSLGIPPPFEQILKLKVSPRFTCPIPTFLKMKLGWTNNGQSSHPSNMTYIATISVSTLQGYIEL